MTKLIMYLFESSILLGFFYVFYILILRKETFFSLNRFFLLGILILSLIFPLVSFDFNPEKDLVVKRPIEEISKIRMSYYEAMSLWEFDSFNKQSISQSHEAEAITINSKNYWFKNLIIILSLLYAFGTLLCLSRLLWTFGWIGNMIASYPHENVDGIKIIKIQKIIAPFSFLNYVFVHDEMIKNPEFDQILLHEKTHIRELYSIDLIFVQLLAAFLWFNPVIWQLIKSLKTTHEYIADKKIITSGYSLVEYQALLLRQLISNNSFGLVHNFNLSFIKKRITMMKNKQSGWKGKVKVALTIAGTIIFSVIIIQCNSQLEDHDTNMSNVIRKSDIKKDINLPVLHERRELIDTDLSGALNFVIAENKLSINGVPHQIDEIGNTIEKGGYNQPTTIVMKIDGDQKMDFVRDVQMELRKSNQRRLLYLGQTAEEKKVEIPLLLPPTPDHEPEFQEPSDEELDAAGYDILKINMGDQTGLSTQKKVYDFVKSHIKKQSTNYVVSGKFLDDDVYKDYLLNLVYIKDAFNQIYQEKAQKMFGKDLFNINEQEFQKVREGIPMVISIGEKPRL